MNNILIITKDMKYCKSLINKIHKDLKDVMVCSIASNDKEIAYSLLNYNIDLVLIDSTYKYYINLEMKKIITKRKLKNSIILILDHELDEINMISSKYLYDYVMKNANLSSIIQKIKILVYTKESLKSCGNNRVQQTILKEKIKNELLYLGYNSSHKGTKYLIEAIYLLSTLKDYYENNLERDIYPIIGKKYGKSVNTIRGCIRFATDTMTYECEEKRLKDYLYMKQYIKPGGKNVVEAVLGRIK